MARFQLRLAALGIFSVVFLLFFAVIKLNEKSQREPPPVRLAKPIVVSSPCKKWKRELMKTRNPVESDKDVVLVTGAAGFIGSSVAKYCSRRLHMKVIAVDNLSSGFAHNLPSTKSSTLEFIRGDLTSVDFVAYLFAKFNITYVYHLADYPASYLSHFTRTFTYRNALMSSSHLINAAVKHDIACFVFVSSTAVYGSQPGSRPIDESRSPRPADPYGISKLAVELDLMTAKDVFGLDYVVLRLHSVFGDGQSSIDPYRNPIARFMRQIVYNEPIVIHGNGQQKRSFTYVSDVVPLISRAPLIPAARNQIFNVGADQMVSMNDLAKMVIAAMGMKGHKIVHTSPRRLEVNQAVFDHSKAYCFFNPPPPTELSIALELTANWFQTIGRSLLKMAKMRRTFVEVKKKLPRLWIEGVTEANNVDHPKRVVQ
ncbi:uncharacterized UDP-glucose epimerase YtcB-like [Oscarella lobularis]|uniref:uncharacterized UDP-glucose epimerase YtcB-like n=1 Tax=Oscarella lobularis TaxID=121494 RepID=UPI0033131E82